MLDGSGGCLLLILYNQSDNVVSAARIIDVMRCTAVISLLICEMESPISPLVVPILAFLFG